MFRVFYCELTTQFCGNSVFAKRRLLCNMCAITVIISIGQNWNNSWIGLSGVTERQPIAFVFGGFSGPLDGTMQDLCQHAFTMMWGESLMLPQTEATVSVKIKTFIS